MEERKKEQEEMEEGRRKKEEGPNPLPSGPAQSCDWNVARASIE
jgi:hypothetical protein